MSGKLIPCDGCNMLAADLGFTYGDLVEVGAIVDGEMVRHFADCPFGENAYPRVTGRQALAKWEKVLAGWKEVFVGWEDVWAMPLAGWRAFWSLFGL